MHRVTKRFMIDAGHRLVGHPGLCRNVHGHGYLIDFTFGGEPGEDGMVVDFFDVEKTIGEWVKQHWDHAFLADRTDPIVQWLEQQHSKMFLFDAPPTAEVMARHAFKEAVRLAPSGVYVVAVRVQETPDCWAEVRP